MRKRVCGFVSDYIVANMTAEGFDNVKKEPVTVSTIFVMILL